MLIKTDGMNSRWMIICCSLFFSFAGQAQQKTNAFDSLVQVIEKRTDYRFYYDRRQTSVLEVDSSYDLQRIELVLKSILNGTGLNFSIDERKRVFISQGPPLLTSLPWDYFKMPDSSRPAEIVVYEPILKKEADAALENRLITIGARSAGSSFILSGYIRDNRNGEPLGSASIIVEDLRVGVASDAFGFYTITIPKGRHTIRVSSLGMKDTRRQLDIRGPGKLDIEMTEDVTSLKAAVIVASKQSSVRGMQMGVERLNIKTIRQIPAVFGETDIMRSLLTLPGVTSVGEGTAGYNVRGGAADQNLVLLNDMTLYNPTHLFGFFSAVDPEVVRGVELYKSAIPEKYGGRISSVLDVSTRDGNSKKFTGTAGVGPLTSKLTLEGPVSEKTTVLFGGRFTYSDWLLKQIDDPSFRNSEASFYDLMVHVSHTFSEKDRIYVSAYTSDDKFRLNDDSTYSYNNRNISLKWKHNFSNKVSLVMTGGLDQYTYKVDGQNNPIDAFKLDFGVKQGNVKADLSYNPDNRNSFSFGFHHIVYDLDPGNLEPADENSLVVPKGLDPEQGTETAVYLGDQYKISDKFSVQAGLRYSLFRNVGPGTVYSYAPGLPRDESTIVDSTTYGKGDLIQQYHGPEIRLSARYLLNDRSSFKISYNTLRQYIHMLTNTTAISPTDIWKLSDQFVKPLTGQQLSAGYYTRFGKKEIEFSVEAYYKLMRNYLDYKSGAQLILNENIEQDIIATKGKAYGIEVLMKKTSGKMTGWMSYTYSRTFLKVDDPVAGENINGGEYYPANFDKPHIASFVGNYRFTQRFSISLTSIYSTGRPLTMPVGTFNMGGAQRVLYSDRNEFRIPDFFRTDFSMTLEGSHNVKQKLHTSWTVGVYNLTGRDNPYSVYFILEDGKINGYQLSVFAVPIPFLSFNIRFQ
jgi:CarboxypepD_reg-like domain/TonB-dependent Receptor Plug Domain